MPRSGSCRYYFTRGTFKRRILAKDNIYQGRSVSTRYWEEDYYYLHACIFLPSSYPILSSLFSGKMGAERGPEKSQPQPWLAWGREGRPVKCCIRGAYVRSTASARFVSRVFLLLPVFDLTLMARYVFGFSIVFFFSFFFFFCLHGGLYFLAAGVLTINPHHPRLDC